MPVPASIEALDVTPASNSFAGTDNANTLDEAIRSAYAFTRQSLTAGSDIASASTITPPSTGSSFNVTGTTTITAIGSTNSWDGRTIILRFTGALTLTHSATLVLPRGVNYITSSGDIAVFRQRSSGVWDCVSYLVASLSTRNSGGNVEIATSVGQLQLGTTGAASVLFFTNSTNAWSIDSSQRLINNANSQPFVSAARGGAAQTAGSTVIFDSQEIEYGGDWYNATTGVATAPVTGRYFATAFVTLRNNGGSSQVVSLTLTLGSRSYTANYDLTAGVARAVSISGFNEVASSGTISVSVSPSLSGGGVTVDASAARLSVGLFG